MCNCWWDGLHGHQTPGLKLHLVEVEVAVNAEGNQEGQDLVSHHVLGDSELGLGQRHFVNTWGGISQISSLTQ